MTPKERAEELFDKMFKKIYNKNMYDDLYTAQQCALIAVDEIINEYDRLLMSDSTMVTDISYWQEVKQEIEKL